MRTRTIRALAFTCVLAIAGSTAALAGPLNGRTYVGSVPSVGLRTVFHRNQLKLHAGGVIILRVAGNGRSVTVRFSSAYPILYCNTSKALKVQSTSAARISGSGKFTAYINQRFQTGPGAAAITQVVSGRFSGGRVSGTIHTEASECSGVASFSASAH